MRKIICLLITVLFAVGLCACGEEEQTTAPAADTGKTTETSTEAPKKETPKQKTVDYDLTKMNSTMVYSTVYDMLSEPEKYEGKMVKMRGEYNAFYSKSTMKYYPAVIIADATACCSQGMEFVLSGDPEYPNAYPIKGDDVTVVGKLKVYYEGTNRFVHLVDSEIA